MSDEKLKIIFIGGAARSGSTLLDRVLGEVEGFFSLGELALVWQEGFVKNMLCGCGKPFKSCNFWTAVVEEAFGGFDKVNPEYIVKLQCSVARTRYIPQLVFPALRSPKFQSMLSEYSDILGRLYRAAQRVSGSKVLVDSSKAPPHGFVLREIQDINLRVVHLIRDSRAVAYSRQRKKMNPAVHWKKAYMGRSSILRSCMDWNLSNLFMQVLYTSTPQYTAVVRYEDLVDKPRETVLKLLKELELDSSDVRFISGNTVELGVAHTASGNPMRFKQGQIEIHPDVEWKQKMPVLKRLIVTALTWPLLLKYGYFREVL